MLSNKERKDLIYRLSSKIVDQFIDFSYNRSDDDIQQSSDQVREYAIQLLSLGCFYLEMSDAIREGDGKRILRCWRYLLPIFWNSRRKNYSNEVLKMLYQHDYSLSPAHVAELLWGRCINVHGHRGKNIPADLHMEHLNRMVKDSIKGLGTNKTRTAVTRVGRALGTIVPILENFDSDNNVPTLSGAHAKLDSTKDIEIVAKELVGVQVFSNIPGRKHLKFPAPRRVLHGQKKELIIDWIAAKIAQLR